MGILFSNITKNFILDILIYVVIFSIIYYMIFSSKKFWESLIVYTIAMEIKFFIEHGSVTIIEFIVSFLSYLIIGLIIVKISYKMADYYTKGVFITVGTMVAYILEILLIEFLFFIIGMIIGVIMLWIYLVIHAIFYWF